MTAQIQKIHASDMFGIFIEMGLGNPVSSKLCEVPGASNTVFCAENPYNGDYSKKLFGIEGRIVSLEAVRTIMNSAKIHYLQKEDPKINTVFVSSFQIGNDNDKSTHGYIGLKYKGKVEYYHMSIHCPLNRALYINSIQETCLSLLEVFGRGVNNSDIDGVWDSNLNPLMEDTFEYISRDKGDVLTYIQDGKILRLEDLIRSAKDGLIVYKGSFNPITNAHLNLMSESSKKFPNYKTVFSISLNTFGKSISDWSNVVERIRLINKLGYGVLICRDPMFDFIHESLTLKYDKEIVYTMGEDTASRYLAGTPNLWMKNRSFIVFDRGNKSCGDSTQWGKSNVYPISSSLSDSSTQVREAIRNNNLESVREMIPTEIFDDLVGSKLFG